MRWISLQRRWVSRHLREHLHYWLRRRRRRDCLRLKSCLPKKSTRQLNRVRGPRMGVVAWDQVAAVDGRVEALQIWRLYRGCALFATRRLDGCQCTIGSTVPGTSEFRLLMNCVTNDAASVITTIFSPSAQSSLGWARAATCRTVTWTWRL